MVEAILCSLDMESTEPNYLVFAKPEAVRRGSCMKRGCVSSPSKHKPNPLTILHKEPKMEVTS